MPGCPGNNCSKFGHCPGPFEHFEQYLCLQISDWSDFRIELWLLFRRCDSKDFINSRRAYWQADIVAGYVGAGDWTCRVGRASPLVRPRVGVVFRLRPFHPFYLRRIRRGLGQRFWFGQVVIFTSFQPCNEVFFLAFGVRSREWA